MAKRRTINDSIEDIIDTKISQIPAIELVTITKVYDNNTHVDCRLNTGDILECIPVMASNVKVDSKALLVPIKNDDFYVISRWYIMEFLDLISILENTDLRRKRIDTRKGVAMTTYQAESSNVSVQINEDMHNNLIQLCLKHDDNNIYLYVNNTLQRNLTKYNINDILNIKIIWQKMKTVAMVVAIEIGTMEIKANAIT